MKYKVLGDDCVACQVICDWSEHENPTYWLHVVTITTRGFTSW